MLWQAHGRMLPAMSQPSHLRVDPHRAGAAPAVIALIVCFVLATWLSLDRAEIVWRTGAFFDSDDAARAVQLRDWLAGQGWYDLSIARMNPPVGVFMHWSRVVDVPLAALMWMAQPFVGPESAERIVRLAFPAALFVALMAACGSAAATLGGARARIAAIVFCFLGAPFLGQFVPGRIDHHAPQILLLVLMTGATLRALGGHAFSAAAAGLCAALSLSISLENVPFIAIIAAAYPLAFVAWGAPRRRTMLSFAAAFAVCLVLLFFATVGPAHRADAVCDAYSIAHLAGGLAGCSALVVLGLLSAVLHGIRARFVALAISASLPVIALVLVAPGCLGDPFVGLDPLVRDLWLRNVVEVEPLPAFLRTHLWSALPIVVPLVTALVVSLVAALRSTTLDRARHAMLAMLVLVCLITSVWGIRVLSSGLPLVAIVAAPFVLGTVDKLALSRAARWSIAALIGLAFAPLPLAFALPDEAVPAGAGSMACLTPEALAPLAELAPGTVLAPIDLGAHILAHTPHATIAAPYHRNNGGNRFALDAFLARPEDARAIVARSGATLLVTCPGQMRALVARAPDGLAARLVAGDVPSWLHEIAHSPALTVFAVAR